MISVFTNFKNGYEMDSLDPTVSNESNQNYPTIKNIYLFLTLTTIS